MPRLRISGIVEESIVDGPGLRYVVFTQGCPHHCPGCHNPQTHDFDGGEFRDTDDILRQFMENPLLAGMTFSGGEPFVQAGPLCHLADAVHAAGKNVYAYSGYTCEELYGLARKMPAVGQLLDKVDVLVDGPYVEALRDLELDFRGSSNQRVLDRAAIEALRPVEA
ncbi:anaerobic ribonucleoside-triphosphate reductase activating protein [Desulfovibrio piger]|uniref:Anaerobic ribonucleoside-triphosphate reductase-activating protein n=1 Tax=Desulfovibrio piger TaxID=901 RepID=A0A1K1LDY4_9BACT|nr:anaerobic ribonucleoside-triphosphate reductase activating protein [Desulfovibrio piger]SFV72901.1 Ribonucleotide reductase of class III (anaerobic), activating protein [Desulfovibrio piger]